MDLLVTVLSIAGTGLAVALVIKLAVTGLARLYNWFVVLLSFDTLRSLVLLPISPRTDLYGWIFVLTQPLTWLLYILAVLELYSVALRTRRGIATLSRWTVMFGMVVAVGVSAITLWADLSRPAARFPVLVYYSIIERGLLFSLALFLLLITAFLAWFPLAVSRNIRLHTSVYSVYFLSLTMADLMRNLAGYEITPTLNLILVSITTFCYVLWLGGLNRRGEEQEVTGRRWKPEDEAALLRQLDALNSAVLRRPAD